VKQFDLLYQASVITRHGISIAVNAYQKKGTKRVFYAMQYKNVFLTKTMHARKWECESCVFKIFETNLPQLENMVLKYKDN
jgi:hypothetical protein